MKYRDYKLCSVLTKTEKERRIKEYLEKKDGLIKEIKELEEKKELLKNDTGKLETFNRNNEKIKCCCGSEIIRKYKSEHEKSIKHKTYIEQQSKE
jgi:hypothetical protein